MPDREITWRDKRCRFDKDHGYGVNVNPKKSEKHTFTGRDQIVVLAEDS